MKREEYEGFGPASGVGEGIGSQEIGVGEGIGREEDWI